MKKNKLKALVKEQKKAAKKELIDQFSGALHAVALNLGLSGKKIAKLIDKNAKQLAKKVKSEKLKIKNQTNVSTIAESEQA